MPLFIGGLFRDRGQAERVVTALLGAGVPSGEISIAVREKAEEDVADREELAGEAHAFTSLATHSAWERLGWPGGARPAYRDKFPPDIEMAFVVAGPIAIAIGGAQLGATSGGVVGSMTNFGFLHDLARQWYDRIVEGQAWVMVRTSEDQRGKLWPIFDKYKAELPGESLRHW